MTRHTIWRLWCASLNLVTDFSDLAQATTALDDPATSGQDLADIAHAQPTLREQVVVHPNVYPGLLDWLEQYGDEAVKQAVQSHRESDATAVPFTLSPPAATMSAEPSSGTRSLSWLPIAAIVVVLAFGIGFGIAALITLVR